MQGWECSKCGKCYAPHVDECKACNEGWAEIRTGTINRPNQTIPVTILIKEVVLGKITNDIEHLPTPPYTPPKLMDC